MRWVSYKHIIPTLFYKAICKIDFNFTSLSKNKPFFMRNNNIYNTHMPNICYMYINDFNASNNRLHDPVYNMISQTNNQRSDWEISIKCKAVKLKKRVLSQFTRKKS